MSNEITKVQDIAGQGKENFPTPLSDALEATRILLGQTRSPAYGDALALCRRIEAYACATEERLLSALKTIREAAIATVQQREPCDATPQPPERGPLTDDERHRAFVAWYQTAECQLTPEAIWAEGFQCAEHTHGIKPLNVELSGHQRPARKDEK